MSFAIVFGCPKSILVFLVSQVILVMTNQILGQGDLKFDL